LAGYLFVAPAMIAIVVFFFGPALAAFILSFTDFDIYALADIRNLRFVWFKNYTELLANPLFWTALKNTLFFVFVGGPLSMAASLSAAILLTENSVKLKAFIRTIFFAPVVTTLVATAVVFKYLLHTKYGFINFGLSKLGINPIDWLGDPNWAMPAIIVFAVWKNFGYNMVIFLSGLQAIPQSLNEAAEIDGAVGVKKFFNITLPLLSPTMFFVSIITVISSFQIFDLVYLMTGGGPQNSTSVMVYWLYKNAFEFFKVGQASAIAYILFFIILILTLIQWKMRKKWVLNEE
jgi:multiple sugar transport system permease protein